MRLSIRVWRYDTVDKPVRHVVVPQPYMPAGLILPQGLGYAMAHTMASRAGSLPPAFKAAQAVNSAMSRVRTGLIPVVPFCC